MTHGLKAIAGLLIAATPGFFACSASTNCIEMGDNLFVNVKMLLDLAVQLDLPTGQNEAAFIVGTAKAVSDVERERVTVCLRAGEGTETEFRILSSRLDGFNQWRRVSALIQRPDAESRVR